MNKRLNLDKPSGNIPRQQTELGSNNKQRLTLLICQEKK